jgi:NAD+ synthase (glutamine-hydrolysing)
VINESNWLLNLCVPTLRVADVSYNSAQILHLLKDTGASSERQQLCLFPQLALSGSTCGDLFFQPLLAQASLHALEKVEHAIANSNLSVVIGLPLMLEDHLYDAVAVIRPQGLCGFVLNQQPDPRYFHAPNQNTPSNLSWTGHQVQIFEQGLLDLPVLDGQKVQVVVGRLPEGRQFTEEGLILNPTALPALADNSLDVHFQQFSSQNQGLLAVCSVGASESTEDGVSSGLCQVWRNGILLAEECELRFESKVLQFDPKNLPTAGSVIASISGEVISPFSDQAAKFDYSIKIPCDPRQPFLLAQDQENQLESAFEIQTTGLMGRMRHTKSENLVLGISGGADSSMALLVCCYALDQLGLPRENLIAVSMPGPGSSGNSINNLADLTNLAGIKARVIPINTALSEHLANIGHDGHTADVTFENAQARERTQILMDLANLHNGLVVGTGDLSEIALGWSTYNGDQMSMYNVNAGLPKTVLLRELVWAADFLFGAEGRRIAQYIVDSPISPELKPLDATGQLSQSTEDVLGPYLLHDFFLWHAIQERNAPTTVFEEARQIFAGEYEPEFILKTLQTFYQRFFRHQFKRAAAPDGPRIFGLSLSARSGWRMPADASPALWLEQLDKIEKTLQPGDGRQ